MVVFIPIYYLELLEGLEVVHFGSCRVFVRYSKHLLFLSTAVSIGSGNMCIRGRHITQNRVMNFVYGCNEFFVSTVSFSVNGPCLCCEKQKKIVTRP